MHCNHCWCRQGLSNIFSVSCTLSSPVALISASRVAAFHHLCPMPYTHSLILVTVGASIIVTFTMDIFCSMPYTYPAFLVITHHARLFRTSKMMNTHTFPLDRVGASIMAACFVTVKICFVSYARSFLLCLVSVTVTAVLIHYCSMSFTGSFSSLGPISISINRKLSAGPVWKGSAITFRNRGFLFKGDSTIAFCILVALVTLARNAECPKDVSARNKRVGI
mmetsp:Transcript_10806/g.23441  ORF Transcript_10806/g.23441 Transcript_10806/m.23441 type:complete len:222 (+) Transcript_10806:582-1247(+)